MLSLVPEYETPGAARQIRVEVRPFRFDLSTPLFARRRRSCNRVARVLCKVQVTLIKEECAIISMSSIVKEL